ncbi:tryptophan synthase beta subunit-like PLP-dependent enzyme [Pseudomassariella vexata]|uniref:L-serine ammonia-lyase n=1 Tax=Pseudomassariella vexata TaxID=1141098 RepID=A0A1Y2EJH4_9PEZI|nr:tryptophan synthase beta subunit-like PLP-dependent enzyme [Pseudomassariella vexata]ORY71710.1 tryptophan synthase beta subunit-like PLP-dependent enzyme [Pseudomassariella vexata]
MMHRAMLAAPTNKVHFYCSSGGNAGLACATSAVALDQPCTIVVPMSTSAHMVAKLRLLGAGVHQVGAHWAEADAHLRENLLAADPTGVYVPPFDHPHIWEGASNIVKELVHQMKPFGIKLDGIVCNCGGGGLLNGIMEGVDSQAWSVKPQVLAVETVGADSLAASIRAGKLVTLDKITSIATSLGAPSVARQTFEWSMEKHFVNTTVTDAEAVMGSVRLADDARMLVEVACGATIAVLFNGELRRKLGKTLSDEEWSKKNVVVIVCGGSNITLEMLRAYQEKYGVS